MKEDTFGTILGVGIVLFVGIMITTYFFTPNWSLFYYPEGCLGCKESWVIELDAYDSKEECRDVGYQMQSEHTGRGDTFECGLKCKVYDASGYLCKETIDF